ncbi:MAG: hypothetical protein ACP5OG_04205 [Candidatus Nanoarchaeia archaeon]
MANKISTTDLENALSSIEQKNKTQEAKPQANSEMPKISKEAEIAFHNGALSTLVAERAELVKIIGQVEAIMQMHLKRLQELGVKIQDQETQQSN